jgi:hypothetical protein
LGSGNAECGKNKEDRVLNWDFGMRNGRKQNAEVGMRNGKALSRGQMAEARVLNSECGRRKAERKKGQSFEFGFRIWDLFDFRFRIFVRI